jgi:hypothetical protein
MSTILALLVGLLALVSPTDAGQPRPAAYYQSAFVAGGLTRSHVASVAGFVGIEWTCDIEQMSDGEVCYAGLSGGRLVTGP